MEGTIERGRIVIRDRVRNVYSGNPIGLTADEAAERLGISVLAVRPRVTELKQTGVLFNTGLRRANLSGIAARVLAHRIFRERWGK